MKRMFLFFLAVGAVLLLLSLFYSGPAVGHLALQVTITPTFSNYLPFVAKNWPPTPTATSTPTPTPTATSTPSPCLPQLGDWTGQESEKNYPVSFTVTSECKVHLFKIKVRFGATTCRITVLEDLPIIDDKFLFDATGVDISGEFDSSTSASGTYRVFLCGSTIIIPASEGTWEAHK